MKRPISVTILFAVSLILAQAPQSGTASAAGSSEPQVWQWKTWVIDSPNQYRVAAPPDVAATAVEIMKLKDMVPQRTSAALDTIAYWATVGPSYRWSEIAVNEALQHGLSSLIANRDLSLLHVAIYDAMVAAWDSKDAYNRPRPSAFDSTLSSVVPNPTSPSYPSEEAAAAGAAASVLAYVFPDRAEFFAEKAEEAGRSLLIAGIAYPSDVSAGFELGRKVATEVIERGKADGSDAKWTGSVPTGPGKWNGTNPVLPMMGIWKPWVLSSPSEFRPEPPPAYDSAEKAAELSELKQFKRTPLTNSIASYWEGAAGGPRFFQYWNQQTSMKLLEYGLGADPARAARAYALVSITLYDAGIACWDAKYAYWAIRPFQLDPNFKPLFTTPNHPSYPAAHGCFSTAAAAILGYLFPRDAAAFDALALQANESRIWAGIHYRSDTVAGRNLGLAVANKVIERARQDGAE
ncbi:phosphatase PAP2 family protein [Mesorhizobium sp. L-8-3]|uniref:phosphatase PAP2 family protein n=1 Tax=Mesorhizobium sp. L-8-3 TaxID=2744522 RepID=UPI0019287E09|nr:phosphatase PAP2 family protein [Mesorhizobium sp. L-8-3]